MSVGSTLDQGLGAVLARPVQSVAGLNILLSLGGVVILAGLDRGQFGSGTIGMMTVMLFLYAGVSALWLVPASPAELPEAGMTSRALAALGAANVVVGLRIPVDTDMGAAFPAVFLMLGVMFLLAWGLRTLGAARGEGEVTAAWDLMSFALLLMPVSAAGGLGFMLLVGWPPAAAVPAAVLTSVVVNPLTGFWVIVHGVPSDPRARG